MTKPTKACLFANYLQSQFANRNTLLQNTNLQFTKIYFTFAFSKLQNQTLKMDISSRLKEFLDYTGMQSTQFADSCGIPRPSFSQLLRGRNKKVSDEVITKIHESFPQLSILWLMFGEGNMVTSSNIEISEPENAGSPYSTPINTLTMSPIIQRPAIPVIIENYHNLQIYLRSQV